MLQFALRNFSAVGRRIRRLPSISSIEPTGEVAIKSIAKLSKTPTGPVGIESLLRLNRFKLARSHNTHGFS